MGKSIKKLLRKTVGGAVGGALAGPAGAAIGNQLGVRREQERRSDEHARDQRRAVALLDEEARVQGELGVNQDFRRKRAEQQYGGSVGSRLLGR